MKIKNYSKKKLKNKKYDSYECFFNSDGMVQISGNNPYIIKKPGKNLIYITYDVNTKIWKKYDEPIINKYPIDIDLKNNTFSLEYINKILPNSKYITLDFYKYYWLNTGKNILQSSGGICKKLAWIFINNINFMLYKGFIYCTSSYCINANKGKKVKYPYVFKKICILKLNLKDLIKPIEQWCVVDIEKHKKITKNVKVDEEKEKSSRFFSHQRDIMKNGKYIMEYKILSPKYQKKLIEKENELSINEKEIKTKNTSTNEKENELSINEKEIKTKNTSTNEKEIKVKQEEIKTKNTSINEKEIKVKQEEIKTKNTSINEKVKKESENKSDVDIKKIGDNEYISSINFSSLVDKLPNENENTTEFQLENDDNYALYNDTGKIIYNDNLKDHLDVLEMIKIFLYTIIDIKDASCVLNGTIPKDLSYIKLR